MAQLYFEAFIGMIHAVFIDLQKFKNHRSPVNDFIVCELKRVKDVWGGGILT